MAQTSTHLVSIYFERSRGLSASTQARSAGTTIVQRSMADVTWECPVWPDLTPMVFRCFRDNQTSTCSPTHFWLFTRLRTTNSYQCSCIIPLSRIDLPTLVSICPSSFPAGSASTYVAFRSLILPPPFQVNQVPVRPHRNPLYHLRRRRDYYPVRYLPASRPLLKQRIP